jgi:hypothetical protein
MPSSSRSKPPDHAPLLAGRAPRKGERIILVGDHPFAGSVGRFEAERDFRDVAGRIGCLVRLDPGVAAGEELCFVFREEHWKPVE